MGRRAGRGFAGAGGSSFPGDPRPAPATIGVSVSKHRRKPHHKPAQRAVVAAPAPASPREQGLKAFRQASYSEAIRLWSLEDAPNQPGVRAALAEAYFRRAFTLGHPPALVLADLQRATELLPGEARYWYHLGLALHRSDQPEA